MCERSVRTVAMFYILLMFRSVKGDSLILISILIFYFQVDYHNSNKTAVFFLSVVYSFVFSQGFLELIVL